MKRAALLVVVALGRQADAGRQLYGWLPPSETVPDGAIAIESSIFERDNLGITHERASVLVLAPVIGISDRLEFALPFELASVTATDVAPGLAFTKFGIETRYRFAPRDATWVPLARFAAVRDVALRSELRAELELAVAYQRGALHVELDAGLVSEFNVGHLHDETRLGVGASVQVNRCLRLGGELHAELALDSASTSWAVIGPNLAWTHRRFWLAGALDIGIHAITAAPRINWGMTW
jgi:hypothetical protein